MANPAILSIHELTPNAAINQPAAEVIDTDGQVSIEARGETSRMFIEVVNNSVNGLLVTVKAEVTTLPLDVTLEGGGAKLIGPLESARYQTAGGWINVAFEAETGSPDAEVRVYRLPRHV
jgi:hypothetical protein